MVLVVELHNRVSDNVRASVRNVTENENPGSVVYQKELFF